MKKQVKAFLKAQLLGYTAELILRQKQGYQGIAINILKSKIAKIEDLLR